MKKKIYIVPLVLAALMLALAILLMCQALFAEKMLPFVGYGGRYNKIFPDILGISHSWFILFLGAIFAIVLAALRHKQYDLTVIQTIIFSTILAIQAVIGSKVLYGIERLMGGNNFNMSGLSLFGGVFFTLMFTPLMAKLFKKNAALLFDFVAPLGMILIASARMGCFFAHCCGAKMQMINGKPFFLPMQLFEVILDLSVLAVLLYLEQNKLTWGKKEKKINLYNGTLALVILASYGTYRFILEFWRDTSKIWLGMSNGQVYALICLAVSVVILFKRKRNYDQALEKQKLHGKKRARRH